MKKHIAAVLSAFTLVGSMAPAAVAAPHGDWRGDRHGDRHGDRDWRHDRSDWRDDRRAARWDAQRHDGYWYNNRWFFGPPPAAYYGRPGFALGYRPWVRGAVLPRYYFARPYYVDYRHYRLRPPPRGYNWVRDERGDFLLAAIATGIIADVIVNSR